MLKKLGSILICCLLFGVVLQFHITGSKAQVLSVNSGTAIYPSSGTILTGLSAQSASIGGSLLAAGSCSSGNVTMTGATTGMATFSTPVTYPGDGTFWDAYVSSSNTVTIKVCAVVLATPTASLYNVRVVQ